MFVYLCVFQLHLLFEILTLKQGKQFKDIFNKACATLAPDALSICESFGIPENQFGPIGKLSSLLFCAMVCHKILFLRQKLAHLQCP